MAQVKPLKLLSNGDMSFIDTATDDLTMNSFTAETVTVNSNLNVTGAGSIDMGGNSITSLATPSASGDAVNKAYVDSAVASHDLSTVMLLDGTQAMTADLPVGGNKIVNVADPVAIGDGANKNYVDNVAALKLDLAGGTMTGGINMGGFAITNMLDPVSAQDAATKSYADSIAAGLDLKESVTVATTSNLDALYDNGSQVGGAGAVGATLTNNGTQTVLSIDGVTASAGMRLIVKDQNDYQKVDVDFSGLTTVPSDLNGDFVTIYDASDTAVHFWFDVTGSDSVPGGATNPVKVDISGETTAVGVADTFRSVVHGTTGFSAAIITTLGTSEVHVINAGQGAVTVGATTDGTNAAVTTVYNVSAGNSVANGIYTVTDIGSGSTNWVLTRAVDADGSPEGEVSYGMHAYVIEGTANNKSGWAVYGGSGVVHLGHDNFTWTQFQGLPNYAGGDGIDITSSVISVDLDTVNSALDFNGGLLRVTPDAVDQTHIRLDNASFLRARNNADSADVNILNVNSSDQIVFASTPLDVDSTAPTLDAELANKKYVDDSVTGLGTGDLKADGSVAMTSDFDLGGFNAINSAAPTASGDLTTKQYVDDAIAGVDFSTVMLLDGTQAMTGNMDLGSNKIVSLATPTVSGDATNKAYVDSQVASVDLTGSVMLLDGTASMTADMNLGSNKIVSLATPTASGDAANKQYVDDAIAGVNLSTVMLLDGTQAMTGNMDLGSFNINNVSDPTSAQQAATKAYVDSQISGSSGWDFSGNAITAGEFLGTTNDEDLIFKRNNVEYLRLNDALFGTNAVLAYDAALARYNSSIGAATYMDIDADEAQFAVVGTFPASGSVSFHGHDGANTAWSGDVWHEGSSFEINDGGTYTGNVTKFSSSFLSLDSSDNGLWNSGQVSIVTDAASGWGTQAGNNANSGNILLKTGDAYNAGVRGNVEVNAGNFFVSDGNVSGYKAQIIGEDDGTPYIGYTANSGLTTGEVILEGSLLIDASYAGTASAVLLGSVVDTTGDGTYTAGNAIVAGGVGEALVGNSAVNSGDVSILTQDGAINGTATDANSGNIVIQTGAAQGAGTRGTISLDAAADDVLLVNAPTGGTALAVASVGYVDAAVAGATASEDVALTFTASGAVAQGAPVYVVSTANDTVAEGDASAIGTSRLIGIAESAVSDSATGKITISGFATIPTARIDGSAFTVGSPVYLSETTGNLTSTAPTTSGSRIYQVGVATASDKLVIDLKQGITVT